MFEGLSVDRPESLPEGWQQSEDGPTLFASALAEAIKSDTDAELLPFLVIAAEMEASGAEVWARAVVQLSLARLTLQLRQPRVDAEELLSDGQRYLDMLSLAVVNGRGVPSALRAVTLTIAARLASDDRKYESAATVFASAAEAWQALGLAQEQAKALQAQSAALHYAQDFPGAEATAARAAAIYEELGNSTGRAMLLLNSAQNSLATGDPDAARARLQEAAPLVGALHDGHITSSFHLTEGLIFVEIEEWTTARRSFLKAERSARRRGDLDQLVVSRKNIAKLTFEHLSKRSGIDWWIKARDAARDAGDWREEREIEHALGVYLSDEKRFTEAEAALERAFNLNVAHDDPLAAAQTQADLGAVLLAWALDANGNGSREPAIALLARAEDTISTARRELERLEDYRWAAIAVRNLRSVWTAGDHPELGIEVLKADAAEFLEIDRDYSGELLRNSALLDLRTMHDPGRVEIAVADLVKATERQRENVQERAWSLSRDAAVVSEAYHLPDAALRLFDSALSLVVQEDDPTTWGNLQNDAALAATDAGDLNGARERLLEAREIAQRTNNRVMLAMATGNLGEISSRRAEWEQAIAYFEEAAKLFDALGELEEAGRIWAAAAGAWIQSGDLDKGGLAAARATSYAESSDSRDVLARAKSARASIEYANSRWEEAYALWMECASLGTPEHVAEYRAFALDSLSRIGDWKRFRRQLDREGGQSQKSGTQIEFAKGLRHAGLTWLSNDRPRAAGVVLGYIVLLSIDGLLKERLEERISEDASRGLDVLKLAASLGTVQAFFSLDGLTERERTAMRDQYERTISRVAGDDASDVIGLVDEFISDDE